MDRGAVCDVSVEEMILVTINDSVRLVVTLNWSGRRPEEVVVPAASHSSSVLAVMNDAASSLLVKISTRSGMVGAAVSRKLSVKVDAAAGTISSTT